jgi:hypothetical protein
VNYPPKTLLEQQCMTFCAVMKAMEGHLTEHNILSTCDKVWMWTKTTLAAELVETNSPVEPPPNPPVEVEKTLPDGTERHQIIVTDVSVLKSGKGRNNQPYTLWKVVDEQHMDYTTFEGTHFDLGKRYGIAFKEIQQGKYLQRRITDFTPLEEDEIPF